MTQESISTKLSELFELHKSGALTKEEFEKLKKQILSDDIVADVEAVKKQMQKIAKTPAKPIQAKKESRIWMFALLGIVLIVIAFFMLRTRAIKDKSELIGQEAQTVKDIDGNVYKTVKIGKQLWMAENLKTTKYNNGDAIPLVIDKVEWALTAPAYCWYNNDISNKNTYGALYNWYAVSKNKLCPKNWHIPTDADWTTLTTYLGGESVVGNKLRETGINHWKRAFNAGATNESGFNALPSGFRNYVGTFYYLGEGCFWWSVTESNAKDALYLNPSDTDTDVRGSNDKRGGFSVRCLRD